MSEPEPNRQPPAPESRPPAPWRDGLRQWVAQLRPTSRALLWSVAAGAQFTVLNAVARLLTQQLHPMQAQFLR